VIQRERRSEGALTVKGKKAVALIGSLLEKLQMAGAHGCGGWPWLPTAVSSDARVGRWRRVAPGAAVGGLNRRGKESGLGRRLRRNGGGSGMSGATWRKGGGRPGFGHATQRRTTWGGGRGWRGVAPAGVRGRQGRAAVVRLPRE
jgi:hypothetical protein